MKTLEVPQIKLADAALGKVDKLLDQQKGELIDTINWPAFPYLPSVRFAMAYDETHLYLKYDVKEQHAQAVTLQSNGPVWEDSCCEFFCSFDDSGYYNLETNCIGAQLLGWHGRDGSKEKATAHVMAALQKSSSLGHTAPLSLEGDVHWQLVLIIPSSVFFRHKDLVFKPGMPLRGNFYKCGDKTNVPHFVSWNAIDWPAPNFHLPGFFGNIILK